MGRIFGTDGVRGLANGEQLTAEFALRLAQAAVQVLAEVKSLGQRRAKAVLVRDPRMSGEFLAAAVAAGLASSGVDVLDAGILPTPAAAFLTAESGADFGVMISASHNPAEDNGIKFFAAGGKKLPDEVEDQIESALQSKPLLPVANQIGRIKSYPDGLELYKKHLLSSMSLRLDGLHVVLDCANGAASLVSPAVFEAAGAKVTVLAAEPDGWNINAGVGSTHLELLQQKVVEYGADLGIAHDGDADRCLAVDNSGKAVYGDQILAILAIGLAQTAKLSQNTVVTTVMSNLGFKLAMQKHGIELLETQVGDRYVLSELDSKNLSLGGEQSGHIILTEYATTGDGILSGLQLMAQMVQQNKSLSELAELMPVFPQVLINVKNVNLAALESNKKVQDLVKQLSAELADSGRILLRKSGTEPVVRIMVEAETDAKAKETAQKLADLVSSELAL